MWITHRIAREVCVSALACGDGLKLAGSKPVSVADGLGVSLVRRRFVTGLANDDRREGNRVVLLLL